MQRYISIALFAFLSYAPLEAKVRHLDVAWADLVSAIEGHPVELVLRDSTAVNGYVRSVTPDALELDIITTSNGKAQPKSPASLPRSRVNTRQYTVLRGKWTALGTAIGAGAGGAVGAPAAIPISNGAPSREPPVSLRGPLAPEPQRASSPAGRPIVRPQSSGSSTNRKDGRLIPGGRSAFGLAGRTLSTISDEAAHGPSRPDDPTQLTVKDL